MQALRNIIYVTSEEAWLRKDGENLVVEVSGAERGRVPLHRIEGVVSLGRAGASPKLLAACAEAGIAVSLLDPNGRFLARVEGPRSGNVLLRRSQYRVADEPWTGSADRARHRRREGRQPAQCGAPRPARPR